jgi:sugar phosphate isomerase/epimerase
MPGFSRRQFIAGSAAAAAALATGSVESLAAPTAAQRRYPLLAFSKPFQDLSPEKAAELVAEVGWDGIECPVRKGGQIEPENVEEALPSMVAAMQKRGKTVGLITTDITRPDARAEKVLRTAARLGITRYRLGSWRYAKDKSIQSQLDAIKAPLRDLAALNKTLGIQGGVQNHSGADTVGAAGWDISELIRGLDPKHLGVCFDIGHATLEGGYSWPVQARLLEPFFTVVYVKDFAWTKTPRGSRAEWVALGHGTIHREFFAWLKKSSHAGPISQHHEYPLPADHAGRVALYRADLQVLDQWLA